MTGSDRARDQGGGVGQGGGGVGFQWGWFRVWVGVGWGWSEEEVGFGWAWVVVWVGLAWARVRVGLGKQQCMRWSQCCVPCMSSHASLQLLHSHMTCEFAGVKLSVTECKA